MASGRRFRFGRFALDVAARELRKDGVRLRLQSQPFTILAMLLERPGEVVTRGELRQRLWADGTFVDFEHGLNAAVRRLRRALGDTAGSQRFIETIPRHGYRFIAAVDPVAAERSRVPTSADDTLRLAALLFMIAGVNECRIP